MAAASPTSSTPCAGCSANRARPELRGESMQDVIFNGSTARKPGSRASVELIFDNADGRAAGQWGTLRRKSRSSASSRATAPRATTSTNLPARRRDIQDIFLGTGLGPRAYAIIGQGMIARIIEAKPEELRVFLKKRQACPSIRNAAARPKPPARYARKPDPRGRHRARVERESGKARSPGDRRDEIQDAAGRRRRKATAAVVVAQERSGQLSPERQQRAISDAQDRTRSTNRQAA